jgi:tRNA A-37 threonylcarbamoyl transferase component Bud32
VAHDDQLIELIERREQLCQQGRDVTPEELCIDCPGRLEDFKRALETLVWFAANLGPEEPLPPTIASPTPPEPSEGDPMPPKLKGFEFVRLLGKGAFGEVWLARDLNLGCERAIKLLPRDRYTQRNIDRLADEARTMARLSKHRNRVQVHLLIPGVTNSFLIMEYVEGGALNKQTSPETPMLWGRAARYVADVADGLAEVHAAGIFHRDIKPANILWDRHKDEALLGDFGIAACAEQASGIAGTKGYIAPELDGGQASAKSDVFSLAATLFCLVAGRPPFATSDLMAGLQQARAGLGRPVAELSRVPQAIEDVIRAGLEPDPARRADLATFTARLRGAHLQALADKLLECSRRAASRVNLRVSVWAADERDLVFRPVACETQIREPTRNLDVVPETAPVASVRTGDLLRLEVDADADGYLTVLNLGSSGELKVVFPNPQAQDNRIRAGRPHRLTVKLTPPAGTDRAAVIWTRHPRDLTPAEWQSRIEAGQVAAVPPHAAVRGMDFVLHEAVEQPGDAWTASVVTISHRLP